jgi:ribosomal-protein-alanine N-acetyltransferase
MERIYAEEIAYHWHYEGKYAFYDMQADQEDFEAFLDVENWEDGFFAVLGAVGELVGFFHYTIENETMTIGLGMKPALTGKGTGRAFVSEGIAYSLHHCTQPVKEVALAVAQFNHRAIRVYESLGFKRVRDFIQATNGGRYDFIEMRKAVQEVKEDPSTLNLR